MSEDGPMRPAPRRSSKPPAGQVARAKIINELSHAIELLRDLPTDGSAVSLKKHKAALLGFAKALAEAEARLDPVVRPTRIFDPAQLDVASHIIALTLVAQPRHPLSGLRPFYGSGVYAIYYNGASLPCYEPLRASEMPIYVGKAEPPKDAPDAVTQGTKLAARLKEHADSIRDATNLDVTDFECRFLVVQSGFEVAAENYLIRLFEPVWNKEMKIAQGLGKHGDSSDTRGNTRSAWDTLHPGRAWAAGSPDNPRSAETIAEDVLTHLTDKKIAGDISSIVSDVLTDLRQFTVEELQAPTGISVAEYSREVDDLLEAADPGPVQPTLDDVD